MQDTTLSQTAQIVPIFTHPSQKNAAANDTNYVTFPVIFRWLLVLFAYACWLIVILPFTLFDTDLPFYLRLQSIPLIMVSLTLAILFQTALNHLRYGLASLFALGLLIACTLA